MPIWFDDSRGLPFLNTLNQASLGEVLGIVFVAMGDDFVTASMPVNATTHQPFGRLHGGASVALAETVASCAGALTVNPATHAVVGMEINANHIRPVSQGHVHATATAEAIGRTSQVWSVRITDDAGQLVCISRMTMAVIEIGRMAVAQ